MKACCRRTVFLALLVAALALPTGCRDLKDKQKPFDIGIESIQIEGSVTDSVSTDVAATLLGAPISLTGSDFNETVDMTGKSEFTLEVADEAGNTSTLTIETQ